MGRHRGVERDFRLLYVCTGNICRSPFAEILTRHLLTGRLGGRAAGAFQGGLVDLNSAPAAAIANTCGIELALATLIVNARAAGITFTSVDDVFTLTEIPFPLWDRIRDRAVVITG